MAGGSLAECDDTHQLSRGSTIPRRAQTYDCPALSAQGSVDRLGRAATASAPFTRTGFRTLPPVGDPSIQDDLHGRVVFERSPEEVVAVLMVPCYDDELSRPSGPRVERPHPPD